jgi:hypothetical protein
VLRLLLLLLLVLLLLLPALLQLLLGLPALAAVGTKHRACRVLTANSTKTLYRKAVLLCSAGDLSCRLSLLRPLLLL